MITNIFLFALALSSTTVVTSFQAKNSIRLRSNSKRMFSPVEDHGNGVVQSFIGHQFHNTLLISDEAVVEAVSIYSKVDKTGFIGGIANVVEQAIDLSHVAIQSFGVENSYGFSIIFFTFLVKLLTLPLTTQQLESTTKMQQLQPLQQKINAKFPNKEDEMTKNQLISQLFQAANVNPLAGCLPALVQIPIFISLYRALQNLIAEDKLSEPFLWIPNLEGPVFKNPPGTSLDWAKSMFSGSPILGWEDTLAFLSLPVILFISQSLSSQVLQPPRDPNKKMTEQEEISQGVVKQLPFIIAFFSLNVPAGLSIYWIINNILTTLVTVTVKSQIKNEPFPLEVETLMASLEAPTSSFRGNQPSSLQELRGVSKVAVSERPKKEGFGTATMKVVDVEAKILESTESGDAPAPAAVAEDEQDSEDSVDAAEGKKSRKSKRKGKKNN